MHKNDTNVFGLGDNEFANNGGTELDDVGEDVNCGRSRDFIFRRQYHFNNLQDARIRQHLQIKVKWVLGCDYCKGGTILGVDGGDRGKGGGDGI